MDKQKEKWVLPTLVIKMVRRLLDSQSTSMDDFLGNRNFSKTREIFPVAIFTLSKILNDGDLWYLRKNDLENSVDDIYARKFEFGASMVHGSPILPIQVMRVTDTSPTKLVDAINKKFTDDLKGTSLVCHFLRDEVIDWKIISQEVLKLHPQLNDVTLIGNIGGNKFVVGQIFPNIFITTVNIELIRINAPSIIEAEKVFKAEDTGLSYLGEAIFSVESDVVKI